VEQFNADQEECRGRSSQLKQKPGSGFLYIIGSGKLAQSLMKAELVDEYVF